MEQPHFFPRPSAIETAEKNKKTATDHTNSVCGCSPILSCIPEHQDTSAVSSGIPCSSDRLASSTHCKTCGIRLTADDKAINLKLISRTVTEFFCIDCLGNHLGCGRAPIEERIKYYRESGNCTLFR